MPVYVGIVVLLVVVLLRAVTGVPKLVDPQSSEAAKQYAEMKERQRDVRWNGFIS